jgi:hypothetical protein
MGIVLLILGLLLGAWRLQADMHGWHQPVTRSSDSAQAGTVAPPAALVIRRGMPSKALPVPLPIAGAPTLDVQLVNDILAAYHSPLRGNGAAIVALSGRYGIDDAVALGFFVMESRIGTQGEAVLTHSVGNMRPLLGQPSLDGYRRYATWMEGVDDWFRVVHDLYLGTLQLTSVESMVPIYAPAADVNDPPMMIAGIRQLVACWHGQVAICPSDPPGMAALVLRDWTAPITLPLQRDPPRPGAIARSGHQS